MLKNEIYLRRKNKIILGKGKENLSNKYISTFLKNINYFGYTFSKELIEVLKTQSIEKITNIYNETVKSLKEMTGSKNTFVPMYPNFPSQVMEMDESELYFNAIMHYVGDEVGLRILLITEVKERFPLLDRVDLKIIDLGNEEEFVSIAQNLISSKTSISQVDKDDIEWFVKQYSKSISSIVPKDIPFKENLAYFTGVLLNNSISDAYYILKNYFKTATDILRLASTLSGGDVSLAEKTEFRNFKRRERKLLLNLLENCGNNIIEDILKYDENWKRLGEKLHPFEYYQDKSSNVYKAFHIIRNSKSKEAKSFKTFNSKIENGILIEDFKNVVNLLKERPGIFARKLDHLLRNSDSKFIIKRFEEVAHEISTPVLLQVMKHFENRNDNKKFRTFFPKGNVAKLKCIENNLPEIENERCLKISDICKKSLIKRFKTLPKIGNVYLDEGLKKFIVPFSQRSASKSIRTLVRGSRIKIENNGNTIRFFIWWKQPIDERVDIDLSGIIYSKNWEKLNQITYFHLQDNKIKGFHSGDITSAPNGACEFIDLDIPSILKNNGRYIIMTVNSFTNQPYKDLPECFAGWMIRQKPNSGEIFEPKTILDKVDLTSDEKACIPLIIDLETREMIWCDMAWKTNSGRVNNVNENSDTISLMGQAVSNLIKPNLYDLLELHCKARGKIVKKKENAKTVFSIHEGDVTPFDIEKIMSEFM